MPVGLFVFDPKKGNFNKSIERKKNALCYVLKYDDILRKETDQFDCLEGTLLINETVVSSLIVLLGSGCS
jgi:hypothetical protein